MAKRHRPASPSELDDIGNNTPIGTTTNNHASPTTNINDDHHSVSSGATSKKINRLDPKLTKQPSPPPVITCNFLPNCNLRPFGSYAEFESHYSQQHMNRCLECHRNFPSERYLSIHIAENHDVFAQLKKERGEKTFACFVEGCDRLCSTPQKRRMHVIDKHGFPKDFYFRVVDHGIDHCDSLLRQPRQYSKNNSGKKRDKVGKPAAGDHDSKMAVDEPDSTGAHDSCETDNTEDGPPTPSPPDVDGGDPGHGTVKTRECEMDDVTDLMASVKLVPRSVKFGRGGSNVGFVPRR